MIVGTLTVKQGDTFSYGGPVLCPSGTWTAAGSMTNAYAKVADFTVTLTPLATPTPTQTHTILVVLSAAQTAAITVGNYLADLKFSDGNGNVQHTEDFTVAVKPAHTV